LPSVGITMFGVTTPAVQKISAELKDAFECLVFHATGVGGRSTRWSGRRWVARHASRSSS